MDDYDDSALSLNIPFRAPPCTLRNVRLTMNDCIPILDPSFGQHITDISIDTFRYEDDDSILGIFQSCPNLASFRLAPRPDHFHYYFHEAADANVYRFSLPFLVTLSISGISYPDDMLSMLSFPSLKDLSLQLFSWYDELPDMLCNVLRSCPHLLRFTLDADGYGTNPDDHDDPDDPFSDDSPICLDSLTYFCVSFPRLARRFMRRLRIPQVQELVARQAPWDIVHHLASSSQQLRKLSLQDTETSHVSPVSPLFLPMLESLHVKCWRQRGKVCAIELFLVPRLVDLRLECQCGSDTSVRQFFWQSTPRPSLVSLSLDGHGDVDGKALMYFLGNSPNLERIRLDVTIIGDLSLAFEDSSSGEVFLPRLRTILGRPGPRAVVDILKCRHKSAVTAGIESCLPPVSSVNARYFSLEYRAAVEVSIAILECTWSQFTHFISRLVVWWFYSGCALNRFFSPIRSRD